MKILACLFKGHISKSMEVISYISKSECKMGKYIHYLAEKSNKITGSNFLMIIFKKL